MQWDIIPYNLLVFTKVATDYNVGVEAEWKSINHTLCDCKACGFRGYLLISIYIKLLFALNLFIKT